MVQAEPVIVGQPTACFWGTMACRLSAVRTVAQGNPDPAIQIPQPLVTCVPHQNSMGVQSGPDKKRAKRKFGFIESVLSDRNINVIG